MVLVAYSILLKKLISVTVFHDMRALPFRASAGSASVACIRPVLLHPRLGQGCKVAFC